MSGISSALFNSANALEVFSRGYDVIENNITNVNTPGYAKQDQLLLAQPFNPALNVTGGVTDGPMISSRSEYLEQAVRTEQQALGDASQRSADLGQVQSLFDLTSSSGVANNLSAFFNSFSQLSVNPNDTVSRQAVINAAGQLAGSI